MRAPTPLLAAAGSAAALLALLSAPLALHAQTGRTVSPAETVPSLTEEPDVEPPRAEPLLVMQARIEALETRVEQLEALVQSLAGGRPAPVTLRADPESGPTLNDPALATTGATEGEIQRHQEKTERLEEEQQTTARRFDDMIEEQDEEAQEEIRERVRNAELIDGDGGGYRRGY